MVRNTGLVEGISIPAMIVIPSPMGISPFAAEVYLITAEVRDQMSQSCN